MFAFTDSFTVGVDICYCTVLLAPVVLVLLIVLLFSVRWWNTRPINKCPHCRTRPTALDIHNKCWKCGCEYDKWGNILEDAPGPLRLDEFDRARFTPRGNTPERGEGSQEYKEADRVRE
jgi:hypothetical protein